MASSPVSQCGKILAYLKTGQSITPAQAYDLYGTLALHSRINELRSQGYAIDCEMVETPTGKVVGRYTLVSRQNAPQRVAAPEPTRDAALPLDPVLVNYGPGKNGVVCEFVVEGYAPGCHPSER